MRWWLFSILLCLALAVRAETVEQAMPNGLVAKADYRRGDPGQAAVILLHGFLQTHEFPTIHNLAEGLAGRGRSVLAPTLSLGVPHRSQSMACEAIHTQTIMEVAGEIAAWVKWLKARHPGPIVLVGHSFGSVELLAYLSDKPDPSITRFIGISLIEGQVSLNASETRLLLAGLRAAAKAGEPRVFSRKFSYCNNYQATPSSLASYLEWTPQRVLTVSDQLQLPHLYIMGSKDERLGRGWVDKLKLRNRVVVIPGANHFMDGEHEFDLLDAVQKELKTK